MCELVFGLTVQVQNKIVCNKKQKKKRELTKKSGLL